MPSAQFAAAIISEHFPHANVELERGALHGVRLGSYNANPDGKLTVTAILPSGELAEVASVTQAHVTQEIAPGPGLDELKERLTLFRTTQEED